VVKEEVTMEGSVVESVQEIVLENDKACEYFI
jgi:hypothetical protein